MSPRRRCMTRLRLFDLLRARDREAARRQRLLALSRCCSRRPECDRRRGERRRRDCERGRVDWSRRRLGVAAATRTEVAPDGFFLCAAFCCAVGRRRRRAGRNWGIAGNIDLSSGRLLSRQARSRSVPCGEARNCWILCRSFMRPGRRCHASSCSRSTSSRPGKIG